MNLENKKQVLIILAACLLGLIAAIGTANIIQSKINNQTKKLKDEYDKKSSGLINEMQLVKKEMQAMTTKQNAIIKQQQALQERPQVTAVQKPEAEKINEVIFSLKTPPGKRAMTILIDSLSAVGGLINPGDFVDVIGELEAKEQAEGDKPTKITSVIMQNVQVLAIGTNFQPVGNSLVYQAQQRTKALNVTLALSPEETGLITFAQANGKLQLTLRSPSEQRTQSLQVASWETLADYVLERQGTQIDLSNQNKNIEETESSEEVGSFVQVYRGGEEL